MKRFRIFIVLFCLGISAPLSYVIWRTYAGVAQEERGQLQFFAEEIFDGMQMELADLIEREEQRSVEAYLATTPASPLAAPPREQFILGYFQNNPDGRMQTPLAADPRNAPEPYRSLVETLQKVNQRFNQRKWKVPRVQSLRESVKEPSQQANQAAFADRYVRSKRSPAKSSLGQQKVRLEELSSRQAAHLSSDDAGKEVPPQMAAAQSADRLQAAYPTREGSPDEIPGSGNASPAAETAARGSASRGAQRFRVEIAPMQSVLIDEKQVFIFRRVAMHNQIFRQGFVLDIPSFLLHLAKVHFRSQPMAHFARLSLSAMMIDRRTQTVTSGAAQQEHRLVAARTFPAPFNFIQAAVSAGRVPASPARSALNTAMFLLGAVLILGIFAIYQSVRSVVDLSEKRSRFVSSVTHELKTPLTNIRMYVEMLEQGMAATPEREQAYLGIIGSESTRLSRLINNVLALSRLEKRQSAVQPVPGRFQKVLDEVRAVMAPKLTQEGFDLTVQAHQGIVFAYDHEAMVQVMINLIENSIKFGRRAAQRHIRIVVDMDEQWVRIDVADTGPGIPRQALQHVFEDFYRADNAQTRATGGTGIGLALVGKLIAAMGGRVAAANNPDAGCTITLLLPFSSHSG